MNLYDINERVENARENGFKLNEIVKLTLKNYSSLSNKNICYYIKLQIPIMHRRVFKIASQNPDCLESICNDLINLFDFACRRWILYKKIF